MRRLEAACQAIGHTAWFIQFSLRGSQGHRLETLKAFPKAYVDFMRTTYALGRMMERGRVVVSEWGDDDNPEDEPGYGAYESFQANRDTAKYRPGQEARAHDDYLERSESTDPPGEG